MNTTQLQGSLTNGRIVSGVAADGVTQLVIRIDTNTPGEQFTVTLQNDQSTTSTSSMEDGGLDFPGNTSFSLSQLTVSAGSADSNGVAHAFAVYRAPIDFARPTSGGYKSTFCKGATMTDDLLECRKVYIQVQDSTNHNISTNVSITILRPPVILVHGLWSDPSVWDNFWPLVNGSNNNSDLRFYVGKANYSAKLSIFTSDPLYPSSAWFAPKENSLGYKHNAPIVLGNIADSIREFKKGKNPMNAQVGAVQADIVTHSLGGVIARTLPLQSSFLAAPTYGQGPIHKLITLATPHLGSPLAAKLLDVINNSCTRIWLAKLIPMYSFNTVTYSSGGSDNGAMMEIVGNGIAVDNSLSSALRAISQPGPHLLPAALVGDYYSNWPSLDCTGILCTPARLKTACPTDPLAQSFSSAGWPANFGSTNNANDGIVGVTSQLNGASTSNLLFGGLAHGPSIVGNYRLAFTGPSILDAAPANPVANQVITLLNTPVYQSPFAPINP